VLTLTATPIPRTLGMALEGLRDLSVIATAPQKRLAIKTFVRNEGRHHPRGLLRELKRGGQVYFLHNEVETIENRRDARSWCPRRASRRPRPDAERELERVMRDFTPACTTCCCARPSSRPASTCPRQHHRHQPRRQVRPGPAAPAARPRRPQHHQAYAYLLVPDVAPDQADASAAGGDPAMEELGSGFYLAMHDLEIRGAGEVLGEHQSGASAPPATAKPCANCRWR
jgi:transcription-repair coupling factor (superfamily II helicase)